MDGDVRRRAPRPASWITYAISTLAVTCLLVIALGGCDLIQSTPRTVVVTATPVPASTLPAGPAVPTWTPFPTYTLPPTWTPEPSPTPTVTPLPSATPTLEGLARANAAQCIREYDAKHYPERNVSAGAPPHEIITSEDGSAYVKTAYHKYPAGWLYWRYEPGPVRGTFACKSVGYEVYPTPAPVAQAGEERIQQVAEIAEEVCRVSIRRKSAFLGADPFSGSGRDYAFNLDEVRPTTEDWALARIAVSSTPSDTLGPKRWSDAGIRYLVYTVADHTCRETEHSRQAWLVWPAILPMSPSTNQ